MQSQNGAINISDYLQNYRNEQQKIVREQQPRLKELLMSLNIARVQAEYDGSGDSGQIEAIYYFDAADNELKGLVDDETERSIESLLYALLEMRHDGWENNDGAFGSFDWNVATNTLQHVHNDRYTEVDTSTYEGFDDAAVGGAGETP